MFNVNDLILNQICTTQFDQFTKEKLIFQSRFYYKFFETIKFNFLSL